VATKKIFRFKKIEIKKNPPPYTTKKNEENDMAARKGSTTDYWYMDCPCGFYCINTKGNQGRGQLKRYNMHKKVCTYAGPSKAPTLDQARKSILNVKGGAIKQHHGITQTNHQNPLGEGDISLNQMANGYYSGKTSAFQAENASFSNKTTRKQRRIQARAEKKRKKKEFRNKRKREKTTKPIQEKEESDEEMMTIDFIKKLSEMGEVTVILM